MTNEEKIVKLEEFKKLLERYYDSDDQSIRSEINRNKSWIRREVLEAGCIKKFTIGPPPAVGGLIMRNIDPFDILFDPPYGVDISSTIYDMLDETIGVLIAGDKMDLNQPDMIVEPDYEKGYAFIAMAINPDDPDLEDVLDSIKEVATNCGIHAERVDEVQSNNRITDRILESIKKAEFIIVDLTHSRPNVFFEAGYAHGLNKIPIYIAKDGTKLEFDLKDYPIIFFKNMRELKTNLEKRLRGLIK